MVQVTWFWEYVFKCLRMTSGQAAKTHSRVAGDTGHGEG